MAVRTVDRRSSRASEQARSRYQAGTTTQLELLQAPRDAFAAEVARIQADADLLNSRAQLRLSAGQSLLPAETDRRHQAPAAAPSSQLAP